jgi:hypothetical protein
MLYHPLNLTNKGGRPDASVLYEMPDQERNERPQEHYYEEWQAGNPGNMPNLRDQNVQDREGITLIIWGLNLGWIFS